MSSKVGQQAARGMAAMAIVALTSRAGSFAAQLALGWLLVPADFGLYGVALGVTSFASVLAQAGLRETLTQRSKRLALWARTAQRLALAIALGGWALVSVGALLAPLSPEREPLRVLLPILGAVWPLTAATTVYEVRLSAQLAFGAIGRAAVSAQLATYALQVLLAWLGLGILALALPAVAGAAIRCALIRRAAGPLPGRPRGRWRALLGRSRWAVGVTLLQMVWSYGDYLLLGARFSAAEVGQYYFAFTLSTVTMTLLTSSISNVLFPALLRLDGAERRWQATRRALSLLALVALPLCALQVLVGTPLLRLVYGGKWALAEGFFAILTVGMALRMVGSPAGALMQALGRFRYQAGFMALLALLFVASLAPGLASGSLLACVVGIGAFYLVVGPANAYAAGRLCGGTAREVLGIFARPAAYALAGVAAAWAVSFEPEHPSSFVLLALARAGAFLASYAACVLLFDRALAAELIAKLASGRRSKLALR